MDAVCWNSCGVECEGASSNEYNVTFRVDMNEQTTNPIGVFITGNFKVGLRCDGHDRRRWRRHLGIHCNVD